MDRAGSSSRPGGKDIGKIFAVAIVLDVVCGIVALGAIRPVQTLIVAVVLAIVPYALMRGPVGRIASRGPRK